MISLLTPPVFAQEEEQTVIVRGDPLPPVDASTWTQTITESDLEMEASGRVENAVGDLGSTQFRRSDARSAHPTSQGLTLRGLGGNAASRVLVLLDGIPQADPFGGWVSWPGYDALPLSSITLERGGGTGEYGSGALAGTLTLKTRDPGEEVVFGGEILAGSRRSIVSRAHTSFPTGPLQHVVGASLDQSDGFVPTAPEQRGNVDEKAPYEQIGAAWRSEMTLGQALNLRASGRAFSDHRARGIPFTENINEGFDASLRAGSHPRANDKWSALVYFQARRLSSSFAAVDDARTLARQTLDQVRVPSSGLGARVAFSPNVGHDGQVEWGADFRRTQGKSEEEYSFVDGAAERGREAGGISETGGLFGKVSWRPSKRVILSAAGRADFWLLHGGFRHEREISGPILTDEEFATRTGIEGTGRLGVGIDAAKSVHLRGASYTGYRLPTLNELYRPFRVGADATAANAELDTERLWGTEVGFDLRPIPGLEASVTGFQNHLLGGIANVTLDEGPGNFEGVGFVSEGGAFRQRRNLSAIHSIGLDAALTLDDRLLPLRGVAWGALYSLVRSEVREGDGSLSGLVPAQVPAQTFASTLSWSSAPDGTKLSTTVRYLGQQFEDDLNQIVLSDALTLDATAKIILASRVHALFRIENLVDTRVEASKTASGLTELAVPRTIWAGLSYGP
jgi:vitamin B12 transporter